MLIPPFLSYHTRRRESLWVGTGPLPVLSFCFSRCWVFLCCCCCVWHAGRHLQPLFTSTTFSSLYSFLFLIFFSYLFTAVRRHDFAYWMRRIGGLGKDQGALNKTAGAETSLLNFSQVGRVGRLIIIERFATRASQVSLFYGDRGGVWV